MKYKKDTSEKILQSAFTEFEEKGYSGARMQSIADRAGINKALLHYYYKSKDALFQIIITRAFKMFLPGAISIFNEEPDFFTAIEKFTAVYIDFLIKHPRIPGFVTQEININPERVVNLFKFSGFNKSLIETKIRKAIDEGLIDETEPVQLIVNVISLLIFPFVTKPIITGIVLDGDKQAYNRFIEERKKEVAKFVIKAIKKGG
jgi:AcrR family transcriptional regulator